MTSVLPDAGARVTVGVGSPVFCIADMTTSYAPEGSGAPAPEVRPPIRLAVLDSDTGFLQVLGKRLERRGLAAPRAREPGAARRDRRRCG